MRNLVEIKYKKQGLYPEVFINGELMSRYMSLSDVIYNDVFAWAERFFDIMDSEFAERYKVVITGHSYHGIVLESMREKSEFCEGVDFQEIKKEIPVLEKIEIVNKYAHQLDLESEFQCENLTVSCKSKEEFDSYNLKNTVYAEQSNYYLLKEGEEIPADVQSKYYIIISKRDEVKKKGAKFFLYVTMQSLPDIINYFNEYHFWLPLIEKSYASLRKKDLSEKVRLELDAYEQEEYRVYVKKLPSRMECGNTERVEYEVYPKSFNKLDLIIESSDTSVAKIESEHIVPVSTGNFKVIVKTCSGQKFFEQEIQSVKHKYVENITLVIPSTSMKIGETMEFKCIVSPIDAEDANEVKFTVSDENVAIITSNNELYSVSAGRVCVTAETNKAVKKFYVSVLPQPASIQLPGEKIKLKFNSEAQVESVVLPVNASPSPVVEWKSSNDNIIAVRSTSDLGCNITAKKFGKANVVAKVKGTEITKSMEVEVSKHGCYVATSVYGSYDCPEVWVLRRFRDQKLRTNLFGRTFVKLYYFVSPKVIKIFSKQRWFNNFWKKILDKMVLSLKEKGFEETPYRGD